jgi:hypothetical protein
MDQPRTDGMPLPASLKNEIAKVVEGQESTIEHLLVRAHCRAATS